MMSSAMLIELATQIPWSKMTSPGMTMLLINEGRRDIEDLANYMGYEVIQWNQYEQGQHLPRNERRTAIYGTCILVPVEHSHEL